METIEVASTLEQALLEQAKQRHVPITGSMELLPLCNMNCDMCYVRLSPEEMAKQGRLRTADEWIALGREMVESGVLFLLLTGGEPLIFPDFKRVYVELRKMGLILTINTNGTLLDEEWADFFGTYKPRRINITLYGADEKAYGELCHYKEGFQKVIQAVRLLRTRGVDVKLSTSVTNVNVDDLERMLAIGEELGVPFRADTYMMPAVRERTKPFSEQSRLTPEEAAKARILALRREMGNNMFFQHAKHIIEEVHKKEEEQKENEKLKRQQENEKKRQGLLEEKEESKEKVGNEKEDRNEQPRCMDCLAGSCSFSVNWQGQLHPCVILTSPSESVFDLGFLPAWQKVQEKLQTIRLHLKCTNCKLRTLCRTCAASALLETGHYDGIPEYMCRYVEESFRQLQQCVAQHEVKKGAVDGELE